MGLVQKMATMLRVLSIRDPEHWRNQSIDAPTGETVNGNSALTLSAFWACINLLAGTIATLPLIVYRTDRSGNRQVDKEHALYRVLHDSPNSLQTAVDFWEFMEASLEMWGNGYARQIRSGGKLIGLMPIMPDAPMVSYGQGASLRYVWSERGKTYELSDKDVFHIRGFGGNPLGGMSTLSFGTRSIGLGLAIEKAAGSTFRNGMRPSVILSFKDWLTVERRNEVHKLLQENFHGAMNAGRPFIAEGGQSISTIAMNPEDAQMLESRAFGVEEICRFFGVPPFMIGHTEKSTSWGTGLEQQTLGFVKFTLRRRLKRIEQAIAKQLLTPEDRARGITIEFNVEGLLRGDSAARATFYQAAMGDTQKPGWMVRNEIRRLENLPPIDGWDDPIPLITDTPKGSEQNDEA